jgi:PGDYG protein
VSRGHFAEKYRAVPPTVEGQAGRYVSLPNTIMAVPMAGPFEVLLADGVSRLKGRAGDWLVDYGDGSLGIVSPAIFATTYETVG